MQQALTKIGASKPSGAGQLARQNACYFNLQANLGKYEFAQGEFTAAVKALNASLEYRGKYPPSDRADDRSRADVSIMLSMALSRLGRSNEANEALEPALALHRTLAKSNTDDHYQHLQLARALYAQALANPAAHAASLREAAALLAALPAGMRKLRSVETWRKRIAGEQAR